MGEVVVVSAALCGGDGLGLVIGRQAARSSGEALDLRVVELRSIGGGPG